MILREESRTCRKRHRCRAALRRQTTSRRNPIDRRARAERVDAATAGRADDRLQLGEAEFDGVKVGTVWRQIPQGRVGLLDGAADAGDLVHAEVIGDDDVARLQRGHQDLFDVGQEAGAVDRAIEDARRGQAGDAEGGEERTGLPPAPRGVVVDPRAAPVRARAGDVRPIVLGRLAGVPSSSCSSTSVRSGCSAINAAKVCRCGSSMGRRPCRWTRGATSPVSRRRCFNSRTHDPLTRYFAATVRSYLKSTLAESRRGTWTFC